MIVRRLFLVLLATTILTLSLAASTASAKEMVPLAANFAETFALSFGGSCPSDSLCATAVGVGNASHLGKTSESIGATVTLPFDAQGCAADVSQVTLTAANGDEVFLTATGSFCETGTPVATDAGAYQITGGTGRFTGATGTGTYLTVATVNASGASGTSTSTYTGTISY